MLFIRQLASPSHHPRDSIGRIPNPKGIRSAPADPAELHSCLPSGRGWLECRDASPQTTHQPSSACSLMTAGRHCGQGREAQGQEVSQATPWSRLGGADLSRDRSQRGQINCPRKAFKQRRLVPGRTQRSPCGFYFKRNKHTPSSLSHGTDNRVEQK